MILQILIAITTAAGLAWKVLFDATRKLKPLWTSGAQLEFDFPPRTLSGLDITVVLLIVLFRSWRHSAVTFCRVILGNSTHDSPEPTDGEELS